MFKVSIDVGGTFTDAVCLTPESMVGTAKSLTTYPDPSDGVIGTLSLLAESLGLGVREFVGSIDVFFHGTTVTTNALLTGDLARTGLIATAGFRDSLEMRKGLREVMFDNRYVAPPPIVPRHLRLGVHERASYDGRILEEVDEESLAEAVETLRDQEVDAVAICLLHAYANPLNERVAEDAVRDALPGVYVTRSSQLLPQMGYYERTSTVCVNAAIGPLLSSYLSRLNDELHGLGFTGTLLVMQSNGGMMSLALSAHQACHSLMSGPAGGVIAARAYSALHGYRHCLAMDMGGTSFDVCPIEDGEAVTTTAGSIGPYRIAIPIIDIRTIGAGGGSIAWIDSGDLLRVGPRSARSDPGPACYGRGGTEPTVTDANLVLGYLDPGSFWGGRMMLDGAAAREAIAKRIAAPLGLRIEDAAFGIHRVVSVNMTAAAREMTVERGHDPREFILVIGGGAGPLHACALVRELSAAGALVPHLSPMMSAAGMLLSDVQHSFIKTLNIQLHYVECQALRRAFAELEAQGEELLNDDGIPAHDREFRLSVDLRYAGQIHEIELPVGPRELATGDVGVLAMRLHARHDELHGYSVDDARIELVNIRVLAIGRMAKLDLSQPIVALPNLPAGSEMTRRAYFGSRIGFAEAPVFAGDLVASSQHIIGPAFVDLRESSIVVEPGFLLKRDTVGNFVLQQTVASSAAAAQARASVMDDLTATDVGSSGWVRPLYHPAKGAEASTSISTPGRPTDQT